MKNYISVLLHVNGNKQAKVKAKTLKQFFLSHPTMALYFTQIMMIYIFFDILHAFTATHWIVHFKSVKKCARSNILLKYLHFSFH